MENENKINEVVNENEDTSLEAGIVPALRDTEIVKEVKNSFLDYAMSVIVARALPDVRDGLKPVHRRCIYGMYEAGYTPDKPFVKSAKIVGDVMGKYHPHGDSSVYEALVRLAQDFNTRYLVVDGHGNFGSVDGDGAAAMRYTEARMHKITTSMLADIDCETVDFEPNFDGSLEEPSVLPVRLPMLLLNGSSGIAVGMATNIPPHNLNEVVDGTIALIDNPQITIEGLMEHIKGPDFPTAATIVGLSDIKQAYETGRGTITIRAHAEIIEHNGKQQIVFTDIPYQVTKMELQKRIAELVRDKVLEGITDLHDESTLTEIKLVVHLKKEANANVVLNNLYKHTSLQTTYGIIFLMLDQGLPKTLNLKEIISKYIDYQREVIYRRTKYDLEKAEKRVHILEGYKIALDNLDAVINIIRNAKDDETAKHELMTKFSLDDVQAESILELKLRRLTGLERSKIEDELNDLLKLIDELKGILASDAKIYEIIKQELLEIKAKYADERRTEIDMTAIDYIDDEALIPEENIVVALTNKGYIKRTTSDTFKSQNRGGVGVKGMTTNEEDFVEHLVDLSTHDYLLFFTNKGKVYRLKGYEIPQFGRQSKGLPIINLLQIDKDERISSVIKISANDDKKYLLFVTKCGIIKKTSLTQFENIRQNGKIAITLKENDELIAAKKTSGNDMVLIGSSEGRMVKFTEDEIRDMGRTASGVKGIDLEDDAIVVGAEVVSNDDNILLVTENGYGKQTKVADFRQTRRGSKGVKALNITDKNGKIADFKVIGDANDVIIVTNSGMIMRMPISQISVLGRITQGVRLINLKDGQKVSTITLIKSTEQNEEESTFSDNNIEPSLDDVQV